MQVENRLIVLKFGSSVLRTESDLPIAVHEIYRWWRDGFQVVAVVSAFGNTTDELTQSAHAVCDRRPLDALWRKRHEAHGHLEQLGLAAKQRR